MTYMILIIMGLVVCHFIAKRQAEERAEYEYGMRMYARLEKYGEFDPEAHEYLKKIGYYNQ